MLTSGQHSHKSVFKILHLHAENINCYYHKIIIQAKEITYYIFDYASKIDDSKLVSSPTCHDKQVYQVTHSWESISVSLYVSHVYKIVIGISILLFAKCIFAKISIPLIIIF